VWLAVGRTDMRRGMNGLALQVQEALGRDPHAGDLYVFRIPPAWAALPRTGRTNDTSVFAGGAVRGSVHKFGYGHKQGAAATPHVA